MVLSVLGIACVSAPFPAQPTPPTYTPTQQTKSRIRADPMKPLIIEWPATSRSQLEALIRRGVVAVRYVGNTMELLPECLPTSEYTYVYSGTNVHRDTLVIENAEELAAHLPLGVASLSGRLEQSGRLEVSLTVVGAYTLDPPALDVGEAGDCGRATHYVSSLGAGAFQLSSGGTAAASAGVDVHGLGAGASTEARRQVINSAGDERACAGSTPDDTAPPSGCGALLRVTLSSVHRETLGADAPSPSPPGQEPAVAAPVRASDAPDGAPLDRSATVPAPLPPPSSSPKPGPVEGPDTWGIIGAGALVTALAGLVVAVVVVAATAEDAPRPERPEGELGSVDLGMAGWALPTELRF